MAMRSLLAQGWPLALLDILLERCSLDLQGWQALGQQGWIEERDNKVWLTASGKREYKKQKVGKYF